MAGIASSTFEEIGWTDSWKAKEWERAPRGPFQAVAPSPGRTARQANARSQPSRQDLGCRRAGFPFRSRNAAESRSQWIFTGISCRVRMSAGWMVWTALSRWNNLQPPRNKKPKRISVVDVVGGDGEQTANLEIRPCAHGAQRRLWGAWNAVSPNQIRPACVLGSRRRLRSPGP